MAAQKTILKKVLIAIPILIAAFLIIAAMQPSHYEVTRSQAFDAPAAAIFPHVNTLKRWEAWSPWGKIDPNMKLTYAGPESGVGASYSWQGNSEVGEGRCTIAESRPNEFIRLNMEFFKPMSGTATAEFTFQPQANQTELTWKVAGEKNLMSKAFCMFVSMDKMIGGRLAMGLIDLKKASESAPASPK